MNKVILIGRLTKDPDVRYTQNEKVVAMFGLTVNREYKTSMALTTPTFLT